MTGGQNLTELNRSLARQHFAKPSPQEMERVMELTGVEREWTRGWQPFEDDTEILRAIGSGVLQKVQATEHLWPIWMLRSEIPRPAALRSYAYWGLQRLSESWRKEATHLGVGSEVVLAGTSFTRPENYQRELVLAGALASPASAHTKGIAVDIDGAGYLVRREGQEPLSVSRRSYQKQLTMRTIRSNLLNRDVREDLIRGPESFDDRVMVALTRAIDTHVRAGVINHTLEFSNEADNDNLCHHIAFNPNYAGVS